MVENQLTQLERALLGTYAHYGKITSMLAQANPLDAGIASEYVEETKRRLAEIKTLESGLTGEGLNPVQARLQKQVTLPYCNAVLRTLLAQIDGATEGFKDSRKSYLIQLGMDGIPLDDTRNALEVYQIEVLRFFDLQKMCKGLKFPRVNPRNKDQYHRACEAALFDSDEHASELLGREIFTPVNINLREDMPHQFLGEINIGFEDSYPNLVRLIYHEGSLGHNTQDRLTDDDSDLRIPFRHTQEGLAILGERLGLEHKYGKNNGNSPIIELLMSKRKVHDAFYAAFERMAYFERLPAREIAMMLRSRLYPQQALVQGLGRLDQARDVGVNCGATPYFVGAQAIQAIYLRALEKINQTYTDENDREMARRALLRTMYTGHRPAFLVGREVDLSLEKKVDAESRVKDVSRASLGF